MAIDKGCLSQDLFSHCNSISINHTPPPFNYLPTTYHLQYQTLFLSDSNAIWICFIRSWERICMCWILFFLNWGQSQSCLLADHLYYSLPIGSSTFKSSWCIWILCLIESGICRSPDLCPETQLNCLRQGSKLQSSDMKTLALTVALWWTPP